MKFLLEVEEEKATMLLELLNDLPYVKIKPFTSYKVKVLEDLKEAVLEMNLVLAGKLDAADDEETLNDAWTDH